jgi:site-specific recombinase XerD
MDRSLLGEFQLDWRLAGKSAATASTYVQWLEHLLLQHPEPTLVDVKEWIASTPSVSFRRKRGQAVRAFGTWAEHNNYELFTWWKMVPLAKERQRPQTTATELDYKKAVCAASTLRDKALVEVLWSCGLRRSEIARLDIADVNFSEGFLIIRTSKTGKPRIAPLSICSASTAKTHWKAQTGFIVWNDYQRHQVVSIAVRCAIGTRLEAWLGGAISSLWCFRNFCSSSGRVV